MESLEDRTAPAVYVWTGGGTTANWSEPANWNFNRAPRPNDDLVFPIGPADKTTTNDLRANTQFKSITFNDSGYTLGGNAIKLTGGITSTATAAGTDDVSLNIMFTRPATVNVGGPTALQLQGKVTGASLMKAGAGTLVLGGATANALTRATVNDGTLQLNKAAGIAAANGLTVATGLVVYAADNQLPDRAGVSVASTGLLDLNNRSDTIGALTLAGGTVSTGTGTLTLSAVGTKALLMRASPATASIAGNLDLGNKVVTVNVPNGASAADLVISAAIHNGGLSKMGAGKLVLSGNSDYAGVTLVRQGVLEVRSANALGATTGNTGVLAGATLSVVGTTIAEPLVLNSATAAAAPALQASGTSGITGTIQLNSRIPALISVAAGGSLMVSGVVSGTGGLTKLDDGALSLTAPSTFTGPVVVLDGSLSTNGPAGTGELVIGNGSTVSPAGTGVGVQNSGSIRFLPGSTLRIDLDQAAVPNLDQLSVIGTVKLGGPTLVLNGVFSDGAKDSYTIVANDGTDPVVGTFAGLPQGATVSVSGPGAITSTYTISYVGGSGNDIVLTRTSNNAPTVGDRTETVAEDGVLTSTLPAATDLDGDPLTYSVVSQPANGVVTITNPASGAFTYTPNADFNGTDTFTFKVNDGTVDSLTATVTITVTAVADVANDTATTNEDTPVTTVNVLANDTFEGLATITGVTQGARGSVVNNGNNTFTYTPNADFNGSDSFTYTVTSGGVIETATVSVTLTAVADIVGDTLTTNEDTAITANVIFGTNGASADSFEGLATITSVTQGTHGTVTFLFNGSVTYTPAADFNGTDSFTYTVTSGGVTETATVNVTITAVADAVNDTATTAEDAAVTTVNVLANDSFEATPAITGFSQGANGSVVNNGNGTFTYTPNADYNGTDSFTYTVTSGGVTETATVNVTITAVADAVNDTATTAEDTAVTTVNVLANDTFEGTPAITAFSQGAHGAVVNNGNGTFTYTPAADFNGTDSFTYTVTSGGVTETATVNITVTAAADAVDDSATVAEDDTLGVLIDPLANDTFEDPPAAITSFTEPANGTLTDNLDGTFTYVPDADFFGSDSFTYTVTSGGVTETATVNITVTEVNDAPVATDDTLADVAEDATPITISFASLLGNDSPGAANEGGQTLTITLVSMFVGGTAVISGTDVIFTLDPDFNGTASFDYTVRDDGTTNGISDPLTDVGSASFTVTAVADAVADPVTVAEDDTLGVLIDPLANDTFEDPAAAITSNTFPANGMLMDNLDGTFTYIPNLNFNGTDSFTYTVTSGGVTETGTVNITVTSVNDEPAGTDNTVTTNEDTDYVFTAADFGFTDPNDTPANDLLAVVINMLPLAGTLTLDGNAVTPGQSVSVSDINDGLLAFTPDADENGTSYASFTFQVQDDGGVAGGGVDTDQTHNIMTIDVTSVNDEPAGADNTVTTNEDTDYVFSAADFGFTDPNDTPADALLNVLITTLPANGTLTLSGIPVTPGQSVSVLDIDAGFLVFSPAADANGLGYDSFTFQVQDDGGTDNGGVDTDQSPKTMTIDVTSVNDEPAGADNTVTTNEDTDYVFSAADFGFTDPNDTPADALLNVLITTLPTAGTLTLGGIAVTPGQSVSASDIDAGALKFSPAANANGLGYDSFMFQVQDDGGVVGGGQDTDQSPDTITIDVTSVNDAPAGTSNTVNAPDNGSYTFTAADFGFTDPNDSPADNFLAVRISNLSLPAGSSLKLNGADVTDGQFVSTADIDAGLLVFTPNPADNATILSYASFQFQVQDDGGTSPGIDLDPTLRTMTINLVP